MNVLFSILVAIFYLYLVVTIIVIILENRDIASTLAWIMIIAIFPVLGFVLYLTFGRNYRRLSKADQMEYQFITDRLVQVMMPLIENQQGILEGLRQRLPSSSEELMLLLVRNSRALITANNNVDLFFWGKDKFKALLDDLKSAQHSIHMEYFIWKADDQIGREIEDILIQKVRDGVKVRLLYDFTGSFRRMRTRHVKRYRKAGIHVYPFFNFLALYKIHTLNHRNHRKIVVIDNKVGYMGGMNIGDEYIDGGKRFDHWRDTHMRVKGPGVQLLQAIFAIDWFNTTEQDLFNRDVFLQMNHPNAITEYRQVMQISTSGYDSKWASILQSYFVLINRAKHNVYIESPYFVPESSLVMALKTAALRGVDVRVVVAGVPDHWLPFWAAKTYFQELLEAGVRIYYYKKGFIHAKVITVDGQLSSVGTANMDMRSLLLNYELNTMIYDEKVTQEIDEQYQLDMEACEEVCLNRLQKESLFIRLRNSLARLLSPLL